MSTHTHTRREKFKTWISVNFGYIITRRNIERSIDYISHSNSIRWYFVNNTMGEFFTPHHPSSDANTNTAEWVALSLEKVILFTSISYHCQFPTKTKYFFQLYALSFFFSFFCTRFSTKNDFQPPRAFLPLLLNSLDLDKPPLWEVLTVFFLYRLQKVIGNV